MLPDDSAIPCINANGTRIKCISKQNWMVRHFEVPRWSCVFIKPTILGVYTMFRHNYTRLWVIHLYMYLITTQQSPFLVGKYPDVELFNSQFPLNIPYTCHGEKLVYIPILPNGHQSHRFICRDLPVQKQSEMMKWPCHIHTMLLGHGIPPRWFNLCLGCLGFMLGLGLYTHKHSGIGGSNPIKNRSESQ